MKLETLATALGALSDAATVIAIIIGAIWTYYLFVKHRQRHPRIGMSIRADVASLQGSSRLIQVSLCLENTGAVLFQPRYAEIRARQVVPLPAELLPSLEKGLDPISPGNATYRWPVLAQRKWSWSVGKFDLEPGESECLQADFVFPATISVLQLYAFVQNPRKESGIGWTHTDLLNIGDEMTTRDRSGGQQQRQQEQQTPQQSQQPTQRPAQQGESPTSGSTSSGQGTRK